MSNNRFDGIRVVETDNRYVARNSEGRVLLKIGKYDKTFSVSRSHRVTKAEVDFCCIMLERFFPEESSDEKLEEMRRFFAYETDKDFFCS